MKGDVCKGMNAAVPFADVMDVDHGVAPFGGDREQGLGIREQLTKVIIAKIAQEGYELIVNRGE